jgi:carbamate kinase
MTSPDGGARPEDQIAAAEVAMIAVADLVADGYDVVVTHGNGPQVGNLLVKNELAASVVPPVPLDWCGAQTQATLGFILMDALEPALAERGIVRPTAALVTRTLVDPGDPAFERPTKPIGRYLSRDDAVVLIEHGQKFEDRGERGWRRVVPSPEPLEILDAPAVAELAAQGYVVVANGGGGIPVVREDGRLRGIEAVIDKDLGATLLAAAVGADRLVIATDVDAATLDFGTDHAAPIGATTVGELRRHAADGQFASGSMGPKVEAVCRFVERTGQIGVITSLGRIVDGVRGEAGTVVHPEAS